MGLARHARPADRRGRRHRPRRGVRGVRTARVALLDAGRPARWWRGSWSTSSAATCRCCGPGSTELERADRPAGVRRAARGTPTCGSTPRTRSTSRAGGPAATAPRKVAVVRLPRISNFTDVDALGLEPGARRRLRVRRRAPSPTPTWSCCPAPARRIADLAWLRARGLDRAIARPRRRRPAGARDLRRLPDARPHRSPTRTASRAEPAPRSTGSGCSTSTTEFTAREGAAASHEPAGYEIHHGRVTRRDSGRGAVTGHDGARRARGRRAPRRRTSREALGRRRPPASFPAARERRLDLLADLVEEHLDVDALLDLAVDGAPRVAARCCRRGPTGEGAAARRHGGGPRRSPPRWSTRGVDVVSSLAGRVARPAAAGRRGADRRLRRSRRAARRTLRTSFDARRRRHPPVLRADLGATPPPPARRGVPLLRLERPGWARPSPIAGPGSTTTTQAAAAAADAGRAAVPDRRSAGARPRSSPRARRHGRCWRGSSTRPTIALPAGVDAAARAAVPTRSTDELALMREHARRRAGHQGLRRRATPGRRWRPPPRSASRSSSYAGRRRPPGVATVTDVDAAADWVAAR